MSEEHRKLAEDLLDCLEFQAVTEELAGEAAYQSKCTVATFKLNERGIQMLADFERKVRLEEAKWWWHYINETHDPKQGLQVMTERIAALEKP